jgi:hypothetical protein
MSPPISQEQLQQFAEVWFRALDTHAPFDDCWRLLADKGLRMHFPDGEVRDELTFRQWYGRATHRFFDEAHTIRSIDTHRSTADAVDATVVVRWQARYWDPPAAESQWIDLESTQQWTVRRSTKNDLGLEIASCILARDFAFAPRSARLPSEVPGHLNELDGLNREIARREQEGGGAVAFFDDHLSPQLVFRRASGQVVGKFGPDGFFATLGSTPFASREVEDLAVHPVGNRAVVTLIAVGRRHDDGSVHRYRNIRVFSHAHGRWIMDAWYNYEIPSL